MSIEIKIRTTDDETMTVKEPAIVRYMFNYCDRDGDVYLCRLQSKTISKIIKYLDFHARSNVSPSDMKAFDDEFLNEEKFDLCRIYVAADAFKIKGLVDLIEPITKSVISMGTRYPKKIMSSSHRTEGDSSKRSKRDDSSKRSKRSRIDSPVDTRYERVNGIQCIIREDDDIVEYIPYKGVFMKFGLIVAAAGEIPEELKNEVISKYRCAVTFSFPSVGVKFGKTDHGEMIACRSSKESLERANKYYDEALQEAIKSQSLEDLISRSTSSATTPSLGSSSSALRLCASGTSPSQPMIEVCMNPDMTANPAVYLDLSNKIKNALKSRYR